MCLLCKSAPSLVFKVYQLLNTCNADQTINSAEKIVTWTFDEESQIEFEKIAGPLIRGKERKITKKNKHLKNAKANEKVAACGAFKANLHQIQWVRGRMSFNFHFSIVTHLQ